MLPRGQQELEWERMHAIGKGSIPGGGRETELLICIGGPCKLCVALRGERKSADNSRRYAEGVTGLWV